MNSDQEYIQIIQSVISKFKPEQTGLSINDLDIDSIDMLTLRVKFEKFIDEKIPGTVWKKFKTFSEIIHYCQSVINQKSGKNNSNQSK
jgi:acyl carrier protein